MLRKRDDWNGLGGEGKKLRKLEFPMGRPSGKAELSRPTLRQWAAYLIPQRLEQVGVEQLEGLEPAS